MILTHSDNCKRSDSNGFDKANNFFDYSFITVIKMMNKLKSTNNFILFKKKLPQFTYLIFQCANTSRQKQWLTEQSKLLKFPKQIYIRSMTFRWHEWKQLKIDITDTMFWTPTKHYFKRFIWIHIVIGSWDYYGNCLDIHWLFQ